jgi:hypothetical protein
MATSLLAAPVVDVGTANGANADAQEGLDKPEEKQHNKKLVCPKALNIA